MHAHHDQPRLRAIGHPRDERLDRTGEIASKVGDWQTRTTPTPHPLPMGSSTLDRLLSEVQETSSRWLTLARAEGAEVVHARRVTDNDWRLTLHVPRSLAWRLLAVVEAAPDAALGTCRTEGRSGIRHVQLEIGCRGSQLLASVLEVVIDHHANRHPHVRLLAMLKVDDSMRPRRIDLLVPARPKPRGRTLTNMLELVTAQPA